MQYFGEIISLAVAVFWTATALFGTLVTVAGVAMFFLL